VSFRERWFLSMWSWCDNQDWSHTQPEIVSFIPLCVLRETWIDYRPSALGKCLDVTIPKKWCAGWNWVPSFYCLTLSSTSTRIA
jgi:hypothetical protein